MLINIFRGFVTIVFAIFYRVEVIGKENVPETGPLILCANHNGELDMFFIGYKIKRLVRYMAKEELFRNPLFAKFITWLGAFPVKRGKGDVEAIKTSLRILENNEVLGIFPEGTRMKNKDAKSIRIKPGVALIAQKSGAPIIPVAVSGRYRPFSKIKVVFGKPFRLDLEKDKKYTNSELVEIAKDIMSKVYALMEEK
ncbi:lysophospholipid acyltransferase family protein [Acetivibrio clariflavus]|uniref:1-acyl-sn-glycerol-3-phosphate acyltransferase n=1 Tax=Acetivibrio clariflavus (strain DSM 19732 / NBRC 101661 / EBR45) TaxID=720554 RepID=G8LU67_ACECE|nr:lysophospholipid acyltransferase family protein [Acetivibrio clariflavus]AEV68455.1 1-acyl-sn-glycerol-3-phosphate acyltransferase [Acetivibrio clariflavus DSM 19732]